VHRQNAMRTDVDYAARLITTLLDYSKLKESVAYNDQL